MSGHKQKLLCFWKKNIFKKNLAITCLWREKKKFIEKKRKDERRQNRKEKKKKEN